MIRGLPKNHYEAIIKQINSSCECGFTEEQHWMVNHIFRPIPKVPTNKCAQCKVSKDQHMFMLHEYQDEYQR